MDKLSSIFGYYLGSDINNLVHCIIGDYDDICKDYPEYIWSWEKIETVSVLVAGKKKVTEKMAIVIEWGAYKLFEIDKDLQRENLKEYLWNKLNYLKLEYKKELYKVDL